MSIRSRDFNRMLIGILDCLILLVDSNPAIGYKLYSIIEDYIKTKDTGSQQAITDFVFSCSSAQLDKINKERTKQAFEFIKMEKMKKLK